MNWEAEQQCYDEMFDPKNFKPLSDEELDKWEAAHTYKTTLEAELRNWLSGETALVNRDMIENFKETFHIDPNGSFQYIAQTLANAYNTGLVTKLEPKTISLLQNVFGIKVNVHD